MAEIWKKVLRCNEVGIHDDVFDLGGDSVLIFQITSRANEAGLNITPALVFRHRTIAEILANISGAKTPTTAPSVISRADRAAFMRKPGLQTTR